MEDTFEKLERVGFPRVCHNLPNEFGVNVLNVRNNLRWKVIVGEYMRNELDNDL